MNVPYPLLFTPVYKNYMWGGERIRDQFTRPDTPTPCAESWEVSAHPDGRSIVENGPLCGKTLNTLCKEYGTSLLGTNCPDEKFPLLIKIIDAKSRLSVQVHPNEDSAARYGGEPKTEMWYILDAKEDAFVCAGFNKGVGPRIFTDALHAGRLPPLLKPLPVAPGKSVFVPGGLVHAIGEGCLILEVQQNSNTTYRVFDWDRIGSDGKPRLLQVREALEVIDWNAHSLGLQTPIPMKAENPANARERALRCDFFTVEQLTLTAPEPVTPTGRSFQVLFAPKSPVFIQTTSETFTLPAGRSCLIPASMPAYTLAAEHPETPLITIEV